MQTVGGRFDCRVENEGRLKEPGTPSTLLVSRERYVAFQELLERKGARVQALLRSMLIRHRYLVRQGLIPASNRVKTRYQPTCGDYVRVSFRPYERDWMELGQLAGAHGLSRCLFFDYLLTLELADYDLEAVLASLPPATGHDLNKPHCLESRVSFFPWCASFVRIFESVPLNDAQLGSIGVYGLTRAPGVSRYPWPHSRYL